MFLKIKLVSIELEIATKNNILVQLYNDKATGVISATEFGIIKNSNTVEIEKLNVRLTDIDFDRKTLEEKILTLSLLIILVRVPCLLILFILINFFQEVLIPKLIILY